MPSEQLTNQLAVAARDLGAENVKVTLEKAVALAVDLIVGCDSAGVSLVHRGKKLDTPASTDDSVLHGDKLQYDLQEGPCMDAVWDQEIVISPDLAHDDRWPTWAPRVVEELGVRSMMCIQLFTDEKRLGALNLYSKRTDGFTHDGDSHEGLALAAHVAVALAAAQEIEHLETGLRNRAVIGQALGILMERFGLKEDRAFQVLQRVSSQTNRKLLLIATELVHTRRLPAAVDLQGGTPSHELSAPGSTLPLSGH